MERKFEITTKTVHAIIAGVTCTALATTTVIPAFAGPARMPAISGGTGILGMPFLIQTQQQETGDIGIGGGSEGGDESGADGKSEKDEKSEREDNSETDDTSETDEGPDPDEGPKTEEDVDSVSDEGNDDDSRRPNKSLTGSRHSEGDPKSRIYYYINSNATDRISGELSNALAACSPDRLERQYRIDCVRLHFLRLARELPTTGEYAPVRAALTKAAADLDTIVRQNLDTSAPRVRVRARGKPAAPLLPPIRAVRSGTEAKVEQQAERVIAEAATALLRSTENSDRRMAHYQQIAAAISSTKVLLRSA